MTTEIKIEDCVRKEVIFDDLKILDCFEYNPGQYYIKTTPVYATLATSQKRQAIFFHGNTLVCPVPASLTIGGAASSYMKELTPVESGVRFIKKEDCYLDTKTGLEWALEDEHRFMAWPTSHNLRGDWRVPTIEELTSIVDYSRSNPATLLSGIKSERYWSASTYAPNTYVAWLVSFNAGGVDASAKASNYYLRAVRGGLKI